MLFRRGRLSTAIFLLAFGQSRKTFYFRLGEADKDALILPEFGIFPGRHGIPEGNQEGSHLLVPPSTHDNMGTVSFHASLTGTKRTVEDSVETALFSVQKTGIRLLDVRAC